MKKEFRTIRDVLSQGRMPDPGLAGSFVDDCLDMCAYPGKGDEYYAAFAAAARKFGEAAKAGDLAAAREAVAELRAIKRSCHDRYKPPKA
jgi:XXXCH domain-containing protein